MKLYILSLILFFSTSNCQYNLKTVVEHNKNHDSAIVDDVQILEKSSSSSIWKKYYVKKTILKQSEKKQNVTSDNIVPLDSLFSVPNEKLQETKDKPITNIQSFLSNAA